MDDNISKIQGEITTYQNQIADTDNRIKGLEYKIYTYQDLKRRSPKSASSYDSQILLLERQIADLKRQSNYTFDRLKRSQYNLSAYQKRAREQGGQGGKKGFGGGFGRSHYGGGGFGGMRKK